MAKTISKEGLPKTFVNLHLLVCGSANNSGLPPGTMPFGQRVCNELKALGYTNICVTGYTGGVSTDGGSITVLRSGTQGGKYYPGTDADSFRQFR